MKSFNIGHNQASHRGTSAVRHNARYYLSPGKLFRKYPGGLVETAASIHPNKAQKTDSVDSKKITALKLDHISINIISLNPAHPGVFASLNDIDGFQ